MFNIYISLVCALIIQLIVINNIISSVAFKKNKNFEMNNFIVNLLELILMLSTTSITCYYFLIDVFDNLTLTFTILLINSLILFRWLVYKTNVLANYVDKVTYEYNDTNNTNTNNTNTNNNNSNNDKKNKIAFSRYHNKNNRDISFETSYPDYNKIKPSTEQVTKMTSNGLGDYSMYNGYDPEHICYKCGCITRENGYTFCGKEIPGMGTIGCSSRWGCRNCKKCAEPSNTAPVNSSNKYTCKQCKCLDGNTGKICGIVSPVDDSIQKCSSDCSQCDSCYGELNNLNDNSNNIYIEANSNLNKIIINNIKNSDLNDIIEN